MAATAAIAGPLALASAACAAEDAGIPVYQPPAGSNQVLEAPIEAAPGHSLIVGDLVMAAGGTIPRHRHLGEEFLYVIGGSATVSREGEADVTLSAGQAIRIAPGTVHWGKAGPEGVRAVSSWVAVDGHPLREAVPE
ncbi:cupin domain-containing protein [Erythrobacter sp. SG61-1L]|uniref:cupin domain-containing protein n=1 Tax=Erythrobacter sp. SG61-1L TaxID=1603897 RepID=UPI00138F6B96|nr:cupin domain-containing protein [Erythrobacter sp. SG61-1L]